MAGEGCTKKCKVSRNARYNLNPRRSIKHLLARYSSCLPVFVGCTCVYVCVFVCMRGCVRVFVTEWKTSVFSGLWDRTEEIADLGFQAQRLCLSRKLRRSPPGMYSITRQTPRPTVHAPRYCSPCPLSSQANSESTCPAFHYK